MRLFHLNDSPQWPGQGGTGAPFRRNSTWELSEINEELIFDIPESVVYRENSVGFDNRFADSAFRPGANPLTSKIGRRNVSISGEIMADTREELAEMERRFKAAVIRPEGKLQVDDHRYINLDSPSEVSWVWRRTSDRALASVQASWICGDPFLYSMEKHEEIVPVDGGQAQLFSINVDPAASIYPISPFISLRSSGGNLIRVILVNFSDENLNFSVNTLGSGFGGIDPQIDIDAERLTVRDLSGSSRLSDFQGEFLRLVPGVNNFQLIEESPFTGEIVFSYRERSF